MQERNGLIFESLLDLSQESSRINVCVQVAFRRAVLRTRKAGAFRPQDGCFSGGYVISTRLLQEVYWRGGNFLEKILILFSTVRRVRCRDRFLSPSLTPDTRQDSIRLRRVRPA